MKGAQPYALINGGGYRNVITKVNVEVIHFKINGNARMTRCALSQFYK
jgi:hypothetical protein